MFGNLLAEILVFLELRVEAPQQHLALVIATASNHMTVLYMQTQTLCVLATPTPVSAVQTLSPVDFQTPAIPIGQYWESEIPEHFLGIDRIVVNIEQANQKEAVIEHFPQAGVSSIKTSAVATGEGTDVYAT